MRKIEKFIQGVVLMLLLSFFIPAHSQQRFFFYAPTDAKEVVMRVYDKGEGGQLLETCKCRIYSDPLNENDTVAGISEWIATPSTKMMNRFYTLEVTTSDGKSRGETAGLGAKAVGINGKRAAVINMEKTNPTGWKIDQRLYTDNPVDLVIYEMHHRDFSVDDSSGIEHKGKFLALTEDTAIAHLKKLGVNAVHILPSFDFASIDEASDKPQYNWGYDPLNYNVPEGSYSTDAADPYSRIREFKEMVMSLHVAGIRVILDVVYNHTFNIEGSAFQRMIPDYYYRKTVDGKYSNGSGCGNETASEKELMRRFIVESVLYWAKEYHIDGFRFDLMGVHDIETMQKVRKELHALDPSIFIYGEGWSAGQCALPEEQLMMKKNMWQAGSDIATYGSGIAAFSDEMRDALRGPFNDDKQGAFLAGLPGKEESIRFGIVGAIDHPQVNLKKVNYTDKAWALQPSQMISYVSCHDDMCLVDRLYASIPKLSEEDMIRLDLLAQTAVLTSQGVPFILSGEEMLRSKKGVHNSYNSPDSINKLPWENMTKYPQVFDYYSKLISMRRGHKAFRLGDADMVRRHLEFLPTPDCVVAYRLKDMGSMDKWNNIVVILNANDRSRMVMVPKGKYTIVCCEGMIEEDGLDNFEGSMVEVAPRSALIMHE